MNVHIILYKCHVIIVIIIIIIIIISDYREVSASVWPVWRTMVDTTRAG